MTLLLLIAIALFCYFRFTPAGRKWGRGVGRFLGMCVLFLFAAYLFIRIGIPLLAMVFAVLAILFPIVDRLFTMYSTFTFFRSAHQQFRGKTVSPETPPVPIRMTKAEAASMLGISENANSEEIKAAYNRLMLKNHPDQGGTNYLASKITEARNILLDKGL